MFTDFSQKCPVSLTRIMSSEQNWKHCCVNSTHKDSLQLQSLSVFIETEGRAAKIYCADTFIKTYSCPNSASKGIAPRKKPDNSKLFSIVCIEKRMFPCEINSLQRIVQVPRSSSDIEELINKYCLLTITD